MPRLTPVTPMPRASEKDKKPQLHPWQRLRSTFDLTCGHGRSARPSLADVVQDREGAPVRRVGLEETDGQARAHSGGEEQRTL